MNSFMQFLPALYFFGALLLGTGYLIVQWRTGGTKATADAITIYREQVDALNLAIDTTRKQAHELTNQVQLLSLEVGRLKGQLEEKDTKIQEYMQIIQGKNPEMLSILGEIRDFMKNLNDKMELTQKRNIRIDTKMQKKVNVK